jgi:hypothetical protein
LAGQRLVELDGEAFGSRRRGSEVGDCCGDEKRSSRRLFMGPGQNRMWWWCEWLAVVSAAFKSSVTAWGEERMGRLHLFQKGKRGVVRQFIGSRGGGWRGSRGTVAHG